MTPRTVAGVLSLIALSAHAQAPATCTNAPAAVTYVERPEGGPNMAAGRRLTTTGFMSAGVDIDSRIEIRFDTSCLRAALGRLAMPAALAARYAELTTRLADLDRAVAGVGVAVDLFAAADTAYAAGVAQRDPRRALPLVRSLDSAMRVIRTSLESAMTARLSAQPSSAVRAQVVAAIGPVVIGTYRFDLLRNLLTTEIAATERELAALPDPNLQVDVRAYLNTASGQTVPIYLPNYNAAATGPETRFDRVELAVSPEQQALYKQYDSLAHTIGNVQSAGAALVAAAQAQYQVVRPDVQNFLTALNTAVAPARASITNLVRWGDPAVRDAWITHVSAALNADPRGAAVIAAWGALDSALTRLAQNEPALSNLAALAPQLSTQDPATAMTAILGAAASLSAQARLDATLLQPARLSQDKALIDAFVSSVNALTPAAKAALTGAGSPYADLAAVATSLPGAVNALSQASSAALQWLVRTIGLDVARAASDLPVPTGQHPQVLGSDVNTMINLRTIPVHRSEGDVVQVQYAFYSNDRRLSPSWTDEFRLRAFGFLGRAVAGLAFTHRTSEPTWSPTAALSWIGTYRRWPKGDGLGLGSIVRWFGLGVSTMSLNFDPQQKVQIGIGATASVFDDRLLGGYGWNLQASEHPGYYFFSVRLFSATGGLGGR